MIGETVRVERKHVAVATTSGSGSFPERFSRMAMQQVSIHAILPATRDERALVSRALQRQLPVLLQRVLVGARHCADVALARGVLVGFVLRHFRAFERLEVALVTLVHLVTVT